MPPDPDERDICNPINVSANQAEKAQELYTLSATNEPIVREAIAHIDSALGTRSKVSRKALKNILGKARRPSILIRKPWFDVEHIRDALRFKSAMEQFRQAPEILTILMARQFEIVKLDTAKMLVPQEWGWRFWGLDLRVPGGQLVEFYSPLKELDTPEVKDTNHELFEKWRGKTREELNESRETVKEYQRDVMLSHERYTEAYLAGIVRMGFCKNNGTVVEPDEDAAAEFWNRIEDELRNASS